MLGGVGEDDFGLARTRELDREGIITTWIARNLSEPSGVALIFVEDHGENRIAYVPGATATIGPEHCLQALAAVRPSLLLATNELAHESLTALFLEARQLGIIVALNAAPDPERAADLLPLVDIVILNAGETQRILACRDVFEPHVGIASLRSRGPGTVILTLGSEGVIGNDREAIFAHRPPSVPVVDTTGAGDTFCGAFVAELATGSSITEAAHYGVLASALSVTKAGAQSGIPTRDQICNSVDAL